MIATASMTSALLLNAQTTQQLLTSHPVRQSARKWFQTSPSGVEITEELIVDFRIGLTPLKDLSTNSESVKRVSEYTYLGTESD